MRRFSTNRVGASAMLRRASYPVAAAAAATLLSIGAARSASAALPRPDHVVVVIEENYSYSDILGPASPATYIKSLAATGGANFTQSYALEHPSQPNYLDLFSGSNQGVLDDDLPVGTPYITPNLGAQLIAGGYSFAGYSESLPAAGSQAETYSTDPDPDVNQYVRKHNPWSNWQAASPTANQLAPSTNQPYTAFPTPSNYASLPTLSFVIPNEQNDMHDGAIAAGDAWLQSNLESYRQWALTHNSMLIVTFDEDDGDNDNQIPTIFCGPMILTGQYSETIDHFRVLRTLEDLYGLPHAGYANLALPITDVFAAPIPSWQNSSGGNWTTATNWYPGSVPASGDTAVFNRSSTPGYTVTIAAATQTGSLTIQNDKLTLALGGNTLTANTALNLAPASGQIANLTLTNGTFTTPAAYIGGSASGSGGSGSAGLLTINSGATLNATSTFKIWNTTGTQVTLNGGTLSAGSLDTDGAPAHLLGNGTTTGWITGTIEITNSNLTIGATAPPNPLGSSLTLATGQTLRIKDNSNVLLVESGATLAFTGGRLDLTNKKMILANASPGSWNGTAYTGVTGQIQSGRNTGSWNGSGIVTSQSSATTGNFTSIGVARASDVKPATATSTATWAGQTITGTDTLVMYTYGGDATLDGRINVDDYIRIDSGIAAGLTGWSNGDFNYDGKVNIDDYTQFIDANIAIQGAPFPTSSGASSGPVSAIPEPAGLSLVLLAACAAALRPRLPRLPLRPLRPRRPRCPR